MTGSLNTALNMGKTHFPQVQQQFAIRFVVSNTFLAFLVFCFIVLVTMFALPACDILPTSTSEPVDRFPKKYFL
jgi:hypothetical protein